MKIVIDMNLSPEWISILETAGHEAIHWLSIGNPQATDKTIMAWAINNDCVVFTHDLDFGTLLAMSQAEVPSVIQIRTQDVLPDSLKHIVLNALQQFQQELETGALVTVDEARAKARMLPINRKSK